MKLQVQPPPRRLLPARWARGALLANLLWLPTPAHASIFKGEALDKLADVLTWVVLIVAPIVGIGVFLLIHILPEKIAEKKQHPQAKAIQCLCLLSLVFGGLLWPLAWLWAYSKPVLYKMAYGTDKVAHGHDEKEHKPARKDEPAELKELVELELLQQRVKELEAKLADKSAGGGKA
jgi:CBS domain containing-hemolysin-like protein